MGDTIIIESLEQQPFEEPLSRSVEEMVDYWSGTGLLEHNGGLKRGELSVIVGRPSKYRKSSFGDVNYELPKS